MKRPSAPAVLLLGEPGNGKTRALATLAAHEHVEKFFYLYTDPGGDESLIDGFIDLGIPISKLHMKYVAPAAEGFDVLRALATKINGLDYESIAKIKSGIDKSGHRQLYDLLDSLSGFECERTGENFGSADSWPDTYAIALDSLTGLNNIARDATVGAKPTLHQGEWGVAMGMEEKFIRKFVAGIKGPRVMTGHLDMTKDETTGRMTLMVSLLGNKLAPQVPHLFSDIVYAGRDGKDFKWSTADTRMALKSRNLPVDDKLEPDFGQIMDKWLSRVKFYEEQGETPAEAAIE